MIQKQPNNNICLRTPPPQFTLINAQRKAATTIQLSVIINVLHVLEGS